MSKKRKLSHVAGKKNKAGHAAAKHGSLKSKGANSNSNSNSNSKSGHASNTNNHERNPPSNQQPTIPFDPDTDNILLVGEGDLSFAASLVAHHKVASLTATVYEDSRDALLAKYPHAADNIECIEQGGARVLYSVDAKTMGPWRTKAKIGGDGGGEGGQGNDNNNDDDNNDDDNKPKTPTRSHKTTRFDRILFNFPHVGGKSTDVNRQVRYNQELLVAFFQRALLSLTPAGSIVVTLFEGEPYTLWNIRDLARHAGLQVERSFRFQFAAYPGYHHARTLGVVHKKGGGTSGAGAGAEASKSAWKGEDRASRSYVFVRKGVVTAAINDQKKKRSRDDSSDDDDDDDDNDSDG